MSTSGGTSPYHHGDLRQALLSAGAELVRHGGAGAVSLREVARRTGVSTAAPYRHFPSREALLAAIAAEGFRQLAATFDAAAGEDRLVALGLAYFHFARENPGLFRLMFGDAIRKDDFPELRAAGQAALVRLSAAIGPAGGGNRDAALTAWAAVHGLAMLAIDRQLSDDLVGADGGGAMAARTLARLRGILAPGGDGA